MKFESIRPGILSDRRDSPPLAQYSHTINTLNNYIEKLFRSSAGINIFSGPDEFSDMKENSQNTLGKEFLSNDEPVFSNSTNTIKPLSTEKFKRNKSRDKSVNTGYIISFSQLL